MVKFLKPGKVVILLTGRYAGKKAVIVKNNDDGTSGRPYGHAIVAGLAKEPRKVIKRSSLKKQEKRSKLKSFMKVVNYQHIMPTRYTLDVDLKSLVTADVVDNSTKRKETRVEVNKILEDKFKTGKNRWFFQKLRF
ncbi:ribosomal protein L27 component of cytosolic 80S ribosome and 60S large subunit [Coccomyxa subellipsoidea C-169]|uniref:60S ribosomal protein L27 n=1 Tax=Coccomyxa subellipsoidea (strain C-169) TaxID=574566 RepID=I0Z4E3_COCSC|nr:ribosomal protein L27 component of cytosolic 80S ribosome and 60S large subunit [Coccomyxa subellipsoidea C-169]EIE25512.1 ribosomal protein L27 component of cytosolic 80S ribosome and 60S large subunit [Coccomyxa subellipsoidea C-169]|eukprot:XP_005650056.1 ribosomal protein L27 component of cytosolic 80S ribosome and 60S large subunit [Coccomyxa subellipsoidea C-169]